MIPRAASSALVVPLSALLLATACAGGAAPGVGASPGPAAGGAGAGGAEGTAIAAAGDTTARPAATDGRAGTARPGGPRPGAPRPGAARAGDDTVEIGFGGRMRRRDMSAAVGSVVNEGYGDQRVGRIEQLLVRIPGVDVTPDGRGGFTVRVRGIRTFGRTGIDAPLWVIDGTPLVGPAAQVLAAIPPMDVDRIDVLKDAAAAAIYGSLGGNGVILVRTRRAGDRPE